MSDAPGPAIGQAPEKGGLLKPKATAIRGSFALGQLKEFAPFRFRHLCGEVQ